MDAALHILNYIKSCPGQGLMFSDASDPNSHRSVTSFCVFYGSSLICWKSKKQNMVPMSSFVAEYRAIALTTCEIQWLLFLLEDLQQSHSISVSLSCNNRSAIQIAQNPTFHERTNHIVLDCHLIRDKVHEGVVHLMPIASAAQLANVYTKALSKGKRKIFRHSHFLKITIT